MSRSGTLLEALTSYYSNVAVGALSVMRSTQEDLRTGQFGLSKVVGNTLSFWLDATEGWWGALLVTASAPLPTMLMILNDDSTHTQVARVLVPGGAQPECTPLGLIGGARTLVASVSVRAFEDGDGVEVKLKDVRSNPPGLYQGLVHVGERPLAIVLVRVEEPSKNVATPKQSKKAKPVPKPKK
jgi:hypothetical protein